MVAQRCEQFNETTLPLNYFVCDIETTGVDRTVDDILQVGWLFCHDGRVVTSGAAYIAQDEDVLREYETGEYVSRKISEGNDGYVKAADVRKYGQDKLKVLRLFRDMYQTAFLCPNTVCVGHNVVSFDIPFLEYRFRKNGIEFQFERNRIIDTGMLYKGWKANMFPMQGEVLHDYFRRVSERRITGLRWDLVCAAEALGAEVDDSKAHGADYDCYLTSQLYQLQRKLLLGL